MRSSAPWPANIMSPTATPPSRTLRPRKRASVTRPANAAHVERAEHPEAQLPRQLAADQVHIGARVDDEGPGAVPVDPDLHPQPTVLQQDAAAAALQPQPLRPGGPGEQHGRGS